MLAPRSQEAAPARADGGPSNFDRLPGAVDGSQDNSAAPSEQEGRYCVASRVLGLGLNEAEAAQSRSTLVVLHEAARARLERLGIRGRALHGLGGPFDGLCVDEVVLQQGERFEFCREAGYHGKRVAIIIPAPDEFGELVDLAAWLPSSDTFALWRGRVELLGAENIFAPRLVGPLVVHESIADWLRAGRLGVFVINAARAAPLLHQVAPLGVKGHAFGRRLREALTVPAPRILVASDAGRVAA